jgi:hypothetical protein
MMSEGALLEFIFKAALEGCDANVKVKKPSGTQAWCCWPTFLNTDPYNRERRLELSARATEFDVHGLLTFLPNHLTRGGAS